jgi:AraC-like DNA-binding protein
MALRAPFNIAHAEIGAAAHLSVRRKQLLRRPRFDLATVLVVLDGRKILAGAGQPVEAGRGGVVLVPPGTETDVVNVPGPAGIYRAILICFAGSLLAAFSQGHPRLVAGRRPLGQPSVLADPIDFVEAVRRAVLGLAGETSAGPELLRHRLVEVLVMLAERGIVFDGLRPLRLAERVGAHMARDLAHAWTAGEVSRDLGLSEPTLRRRLAEEGTSFSRVLADARLGRALFLLQSSEEDVTRIALDVGYRSASRFAARFRQRYGLPPSQAR